MNCANHPERTATAFCQSCGKPLCPECIRSADGLILCEPCFLARTSAAAQPAHAPGSGPAYGPSYGPAYASVTGAASTASQAGSQSRSSGNSGWSAVPPVPGSPPPFAGAPAPYAGAPPSPFLAGVLGFIPGVGAMYNGQFVKALLHVVIFIVLIGVSEHFDLAGILIPAWVFYQVFDAAQTAAARRDGRPLPDPFGILDMSQRLGPQSNFQSSAQAGHHSGGYTPSAYPPPGNSPGPASPTSAGAAAPGSYAAAEAPGAAYSAPQPGQPGPYGDPRWESYAPPGGQQQYVRGADGRWTTVNTAPAAYSPAPPRRGEPVGAIVLIVVGLLFLLSTLGVLDVDWIGRGWPVLLLLLGIWLLVRRATAPPQFPGPSGPPYAPPYPDPPAPAPASGGNPLSIVPSHQGRPDASDPMPVSEITGTQTGSHEEDKR